jgi:hypothetical protein
MSNKVIYPVLIIIFSLLVIYFIINSRNNEKFTNQIDFIKKDYLIHEESNLKFNASNNSKFTMDLANGTWTSPVTTVDNDYNVKNLIIIQINHTLDGNNSNYGTIQLNLNDVHMSGNVGIPIIFVSNETIIATFGVITVHIKMYNKFTDENKINHNKAFYLTETPQCLFEIFVNDSLKYKFVSYKVFNNKVGAELYRIIKAKDFYADSPSSVYDMTAYNLIIGPQYKFPPNYVKLNFGTNNNDVFSKLSGSYTNILKFSIQRVFSSPTNNEIITQTSPVLTLTPTQGHQIPTTIEIVPFLQDQTLNQLQSFFKPKATIIYFYKLTNYQTNYDYQNDVIPPVPSATALSLKNNAQTNMFKQNIHYNNLSGVEQINTSTFTMTLFNRYTSNLNDPTIIQFSDLIPNL